MAAAKKLDWTITMQHPKSIKKVFFFTPNGEHRDNISVNKNNRKNTLSTEIHIASVGTVKTIDLRIKGRYCRQLVNHKEENSTGQKQYDFL